MKQRTVIFLGSLTTLILVLGFLRHWSAQRQQVIEVPLAGIETGVDAVLEQRDQAAQAEAEAAQSGLVEDQMLIAHQAIVAALQQWGPVEELVDGQLVVTDPLVCARAKTLERKLTDWRGQTGQDLERIYQQELAAQLRRANDWNLNSTGVSGEAGAIAISRATIGDTRALLWLGDLIYSNRSVPFCKDSYAQEIASLGQVFNEVAARVEVRDENMARLRQEQVQKAQQVWEDQEPSIARKPVDPPAEVTTDGVAPVDAAPISDSEEGRGPLGRLFYGDE